MSGPDGEPSLAGEVLDDRYEIGESIDRGGMGTVYRAWDRGLERQVVVKIPHARLMSDRSFRQRFLQEIRDLAKHEHPAILRIEASGEHRDLPYAVVQYLGGGSLRERIQRQGGRQTPRQVLEWLPTIADALDFVHRRGSLHRDVKPANILFDERGNAVLSDFGIATAIGAADPDAPTEEARRELTVVGTFVGSPAYAPPEAIDRLHTPAYDQYSLATVVFLALTGELPFSGSTNEAILVAKEKSEPPRIDRRLLAAPLPRAAEKVLRKALSRRPEDRFESCTAFTQAFASALDARGPSIPSPRWLAAAALTGLAGLGLLLLVSTEPGPETARAADDGMIPFDPGTQPVRLGSTEAEIDQAVELCQRSGGSEAECSRELFEDERLRTRPIGPFALDRHEVTNAEFAAFAEDTGHRTTAEQRGYSYDITRCRSCSWRTPADGRIAEANPSDPVVHVSWIDADAFCRWRSARLPTEDEWELAARGRTRRTFPWGDRWEDSKLSLPSEAGIGLQPVGSQPGDTTPEGVRDLAGSVSEWTSTPSGSGASGERRIFKGGSWVDRLPAYFRAAAFSDAAPEFSSISLGFRCARSLDPGDA